MASYAETREPFFHYCTSLCAIIGGVFTVAGILDRFLFSMMKNIEKMELGKLN